MKIVAVFVFITYLATVLADQDDFPMIWNCDDIKCVDMIFVGPPCFKWCPHGHTCRVLETGDIIKAGQTYNLGRMTCKCRDKSLPNWDIARCTL